MAMMMQLTIDSRKSGQVLENSNISSRFSDVLIEEKPFFYTLTHEKLKTGVRE